VRWRSSRYFAVLAGATLVVALASRAVSRRFLFPAQDVRLGAPPAGLAASRVIARDGVPVELLELGVAGAARVVVHFHNNRETAQDSAGIARELAARGVGVVLVEYRGYGASARETPSASPSEDGLYADAEAALDMLAARGIGPERIVLWGTSLGTGVAAEMARRGRGGRLVLVTPYTSIPDLVTNVAPFVPASVLVADHFDTLAKAGAIAVPTVVVHGDADEIVPFHMGEKVTAAIHGARLLRIAGGRHGDLWIRAHGALVEAIVGVGQRSEE
jgi:fermentation-respiration switch protein FrsA (DUF1100 family)